MRNVLKWRSTLLFGLVVLLVIPLVGCSKADDETYNYLSEMREWQDNWNEKWPWELEELGDLADELRAIEPPRHPIPLEFSDVGTIDYWTFSDHYEYIFAHRHWLELRGHLERMEQLEKIHHPDLWEEEAEPNCSIALEYGQGSPEYKDACWIVDKATEHLGFVEGRLLGYFVMYLPERSDGE